MRSTECFSSCLCFIISSFSCSAAGRSLTVSPYCSRICIYLYLLLSSPLQLKLLSPAVSSCRCYKPSREKHKTQGRTWVLSVNIHAHWQYKNYDTVPKYDHRLRGSASTVLTATSQINGRWRILTPHRIETHEPTATKFRTFDYVREGTP